MGQSTCTEPDCDKPILAKGLCNACYQRAHKPPRPEPIQCALDGCPNMAVRSSAQGWCSPHHKRWRDTGSPLPREKERCSIPACDKPVNCRGWCKKHYGRWRMHGDPNIVKRAVRPQRTEAEIAGVGEKTCPTCNEARPLDDFPRRRETPDGRGYVCRDCVRRAAYRKKYAENAEFRMRRADYNRKHRDTVPPEVRAAGQRAAKLHAMYGITPEQFDRMSEAQGRVCAICRNPPVGKKYLSVDHHHESRQVRGLLCDRCNAALGLLGEDPDRFIAAIEYLKNPPASLLV